MNDSLLKVIEREKKNMEGRFCNVPSVNNVISLACSGFVRIAQAAQKPRVMKVWTDDCKPEKAGLYWIKELGCEKIFAKMLTDMEIQDGVAYCLPNRRISHWLEVEPTPIYRRIENE